MDKKTDRKFYWEVKDFMFNQTAPKSKKTAPDIKNAVKSILEQNQPFKQKNITPNNNTIETVGQVISLFEGKQKGFIPSTVAHSKNIDTNPFRQINEAPFGWAAIKNLFSGGTQQLVGGTKETADFIKQRDLEGEQYKQQMMAQMAQEEDEEEETEAYRRFVGAPEPTETKSGAKVSPMPSWVKQAQQAAPVAAEEPAGEEAETEAPEQIAEPEEDIAAMRKKAEEIGGVPQPQEALPGKDITFQTPEQIAAMNEPTMGGQSGVFGAGQQASQVAAKPTQMGTAQEREAYQKARQAAYEKSNLRKRQEAEQALARAQQTMKSGSVSEKNKAALAGNIVRLQQEVEGSRDLSAEKMAGMAARDTERRFRTPEQKAAKEAENASVVADLARRADEVRKREAESKVATQSGTKTQSASQTSPKSYRI